MAVTVRKCDEGYSYLETITTADENAVQKSKLIFVEYVAKGIITAPSYEAAEWYISDGVRPKCRINLRIDEVHFKRECVDRLGCSLREYQYTMRVMLTSLLGMAVPSLNNLAREMRRLANELECYSPNYAVQEYVYIGDFLDLLPGDTMWRTQLVEKFDVSVWQQTDRHAIKQRTLANYQSYFKFDRYLKQFWQEATKEERLLYFPIYYWWNLTAILPLRPLECVVTPRDCLHRKDGKSDLTIRRTRLKGRKLSAQYDIEKDYEKKTYQVLESFADEIEAYITATSDVYDSDVYTLFCKTTQFRCLHTNLDSRHYAYDNLNQCLRHFHGKVLVGRYGLQVLQRGTADTLGENEIEKIRLGDTRHIALISLMVSGGSATICKELAGHGDIEIGHHYYSNIRSFLDVLSLERTRQQPEQGTGTAANPPCAELRDQISLNALKKLDSATQIQGGYCISEATAHGNFEPCESAVDAYGRSGICRECRFFVPRRGADVYHAIEAADEELRDTIILLKQSIEAVRRAEGDIESIACVLEQLGAKSIKYVHYKTMSTENEVLELKKRMEDHK